MAFVRALAQMEREESQTTGSKMSLAQKGQEESQYMLSSEQDQKFYRNHPAPVPVTSSAHERILWSYPIMTSLFAFLKERLGPSSGPRLN